KCCRNHHSTPSERDVGRGAHCCGTAPQAWPLRVAADGAALHAAAWATAESRPVEPVEHVRAQPCGGDARLRFLRDDHGEVSDAVRLCGPGCRDAWDRALE